MVHAAAWEESQLPKSGVLDMNVLVPPPGAVDHPDTLPFLAGKREEDGSGNKSFPPDGKADEPDCGKHLRQAS